MAGTLLLVLVLVTATAELVLTTTSTVRGFSPTQGDDAGCNTTCSGYVGERYQQQLDVARECIAVTLPTVCSRATSLLSPSRMVVSIEDGSGRRYSCETVGGGTVPMVAFLKDEQNRPACEVRALTPELIGRKVSLSEEDYLNSQPRGGSNGVMLLCTFTNGLKLYLRTLQRVKVTSNNICLTYIFSGQPASLPPAVAAPTGPPVHGLAPTSNGTQSPPATQQNSSGTPTTSPVAVSTGPQRLSLAPTPNETFPITNNSQSFSAVAQPTQKSSVAPTSDSLTPSEKPSVSTTNKLGLIVLAAIPGGAVVSVLIFYLSVRCAKWWHDHSAHFSKAKLPVHATHSFTPDDESGSKDLWREEPHNNTTEIGPVQAASQQLNVPRYTKIENGPTTFDAQDPAHKAQPLKRTGQHPDLDSSRQIINNKYRFEAEDTQIKSGHSNIKEESKDGRIAHTQRVLLSSP